MSQKISLVRLLTTKGKILEKSGWMDFTNGVHDDDGNLYPAGFDSTGCVHGTSGNPKTGQILFEDGKDTGYNINENYISLVCLRVVHKNFKKLYNGN